MENLQERLAQAKIDQAEIAASVKELEQQIESKKIPCWIKLGMIFESETSGNLFMVTRINGTQYTINTVLITGRGHGAGLVGNFARTFGSTYTQDELRRKIVDCGMIYRGHFNDLFEREA